MLFKDSFVLIDLEYTAWEGSVSRKWKGQNEFREIIEIGALHIDYSNNFYKVINRFNQLVIPTINKNLSNYIVDLTGITNDDIINNGISFNRAFNNFILFLKNTSKNVFQYGTDSEVIRENLKINSIDYDLDKINFNNIRPFIEKRLNIQKNKIDSSGLCEYLGLKDNNIKHRAIEDCLALLKVINFINKKYGRIIF